jgi:hypothetical protein
VGGKRAFVGRTMCPALRRMEKKNAYGAYFIFNAWNRAGSFRITRNLIFQRHFPSKDCSSEFARAAYGG